MVTDRSTSGVSVSMSLAELFPGFGSVAAGGAATVAVLETDPEAEASTSAVTVNVAVPPAIRLTMLLMLPTPAAGQLPPTAAQLHTAFDRLAANASTTEAPTTSDGPLLVTTIV